MTSQPGKQTYCPRSLSKYNQTMKFSQLIEYKIEIEYISGSIVFIQFVFIVCPVEGYRNISKLSCRILPFTPYKAFLKNKTKQKEARNLSLSHFLQNI